MTASLLALIVVQTHEVSAALLREAVIGTPTSIRKLVSDGADVRYQDQFGRTALMLACEAGPADNYKALISLKSDVNQVDNEGLSPLFYAASGGRHAALPLLKAAGSKLEHRNKKGQTALAHAVWFARDECVRQLLKLGADPNSQDMKGRTPLSLATLWTRDDPRDYETENRYAVIINHLVNYGAKLNQSDHVGVTPLMVASARNHYVLVEALGVRKANYKLTDRFGRTALTFAAFRGPEDRIVQYLIAKGLKPGVTELMLFGRTRDALKLLKAGHPSKVPGPRREPILAVACEQGDLQSVRWLVKSGVKINEQDDAGWTPIMYAVAGRPNESQLSGRRRFPNLKPEGQRLELIKFLVDAGAAVRTVSKEGDTALRLALETRQRRISEYLGLHSPSE